MEDSTARVWAQQHACKRDLHMIPRNMYREVKVQIAMWPQGATLILHTEDSA